MLFYGVTTGLEFLALVRLRSLEPLTPRPYRVPLRDGLPLTPFFLAPILLCALLVAVADATSLAAFGGALALGGVLLPARRPARRWSRSRHPQRRRCCESLRSCSLSAGGFHPGAGRRKRRLWKDTL